MTAPLEAPVPGPAPASPAVADLRKDDPRTAVELWKRRVAATPEAVAFRYYDERRLAGHDLPRGGRARRARSRPAWSRAAWFRAIASACCRRRGSSGCCATSPILLAGGVTVPIYASNTAEQCEFIVRDAGAKIVIVEDAAQRDKLVGAARQAVHGRAPDPADGRSAGRPDAAAGGGRAGAVAVRAVAGGAAGGRAAVGRRASGRAGRARRDGRRPSRCSRSSTRRGRPACPRASC